MSPAVTSPPDHLPPPGLRSSKVWHRKLTLCFSSRSFRHSCTFDFNGYEAEFHSELSSGSEEGGDRRRDSSYLVSDRSEGGKREGVKGGVRGGVYDTLRSVRVR